MGKKFDFKLEGLLKLREFKEHNTKMELGEINRIILGTQDKIAELKKNVGIGYESQEALLEGGVSGKLIQFYPYYTQAILEHIQKLKTELEQKQKEYDEKLKELSQRKKEVEVIQKLKDKEHFKYKKELNKKEEAEIFDINLMRDSWTKLKEKV